MDFQFDIALSKRIFWKYRFLGFLEDIIGLPHVTKVIKRQFTDQIDWCFMILKYISSFLVLLKGMSILKGYYEWCRDSGDVS